MLPKHVGIIVDNVVIVHNRRKKSIEYNCFNLIAGEIEHHKFATLSSYNPIEELQNVVINNNNNNRVVNNNKNHYNYICFSIFFNLLSKEIIDQLQMSIQIF
jgi:hypothetical protein